MTGYSSDDDLEMGRTSLAEEFLLSAALLVGYAAGGVSRLHSKWLYATRPLAFFYPKGGGGTLSFPESSPFHSKHISKLTARLASCAPVSSSVQNRLMDEAFFSVKALPSQIDLVRCGLNDGILSRVVRQSERVAGEAADSLSRDRVADAVSVGTGTDATGCYLKTFIGEDVRSALVDWVYEDLIPAGCLHLSRQFGVSEQRVPSSLS